MNGFWRNMPTLTLVITMAVLLLAAAALLTWRRQRRAGAREPMPGLAERYPFLQVRPLSEREQVLYWRLRHVMPDLMVLAQVGMSRILRVEKGHDFRAWLNRIDRMTVDFVVCLADGTIVAAIELDDHSHEADERALADAKKAKALESAGVKLLRYRELPSETDLRRVFLE
jgi:hypothetical protein